jgi:hypothetical protein
VGASRYDWDKLVGEPRAPIGTLRQSSHRLIDASYRLGERWSATGQLWRYRLAGERIDTLALGLVYRFKDEPGADRGL